MRFEIVPFTPDLLADAGALLAHRHAANRAAIPLLPRRFSEPAVAANAIKAALARPLASGVAAVADGRLLGYLVGDMVFDTTWGRAAWVRLPGYALAHDQSVEVLRDLYAALGKRWVAYGCYAHIALVSTADPVVLDAWFRLSFGVEQMHGLLDLAAHDVPPDDQRFAIRRATSDDGALLAGFANTIWRQQVGAPTWAFTAPERADELPALYADEVHDPDATTWIAFDNGEAVGFQSFYPYPESDEALFVPPGCAELATAATLPTARGRGVGTALARHGLAWAKAEGYEVVETDWRSTNLLSSRFWPKIGFQPVAYRLARRIDVRIAFAAGQA